MGPGNRFGEGFEVLRILEDVSKICDAQLGSEAYRIDETPRCIAPKATEEFIVAKPKSSQEVAKLLSYANSKGIAVFVRGGGTGLSGGAVPTVPGIVLSTERLKDLRIDERSRIAECGAGVTLYELERTAELAGFSFPPHPGAETATVGGMIATNAGGMRALRYGTMRNYVLAIEVVLPSGKVLQLGSRTLKNSTGYQLMQLFIGSEGTLGVVTKAWIKLHPAMREAVTLAIPFSSVDAAIECVAELAKLTLPLALEFMEDRAVRIGERVCGLRWPGSGEAHLLVMLENFAEAEKVAEIAEKHGALDVFVATSRREQRELMRIRGSIYEGLKNEIIEILDVCVPPGFIAEYVKKSNEIAAEYGIDVITYGHAGDGNVHQHPLLYEGWEESYFEFRERLFELAKSYGGIISGEHGIGCVKREELRKLYPEQYELMRAIKAIFDPKGIMNPGKVI